ncbi:monooxygenase [Aspergillus taichungensis]|uniref:Monooxygenase n=1 Tax=Aspergillus taichungensis TaxID=482145 RepID=A0A2J5I955_9EURO|nr:monooxygenase [Aspergillus taichungensis]
MEEKEKNTSYSQVACIGAGLSAIALGASLKRWYKIDNIRFFERHEESGGTWAINSYPGCACDVPSALYSFSFALNPKWTKLMPSWEEIKAYQEEVAAKYSLRDKMHFRTEVVECTWQEDTARWLLVLRDLASGETFHHECQILISATGLLVQPRECDIPGAASFKGALFHSARWDHSVVLEGKRVVVVGNGCTGTQIVPAIVDKVASVTHVVRTKHWFVKAINGAYPRILLWIFRFIPFAMRLHRLHIFLLMEMAYRLFPNTKAAARLRQKTRNEAEAYIRKTAPEKYHDLLIPDFEIGCKRRIFDPMYLPTLHNEKVSLTKTDITAILPDGIQITDGFIPADIIVLATGFQTNKFLPYTQVHGRDGTIQEHWQRFDGPGAYNCTALSGFPNFFMILGPNTATGHTSALMASENAINYAMRVLKPVLKGEADYVEVKQEAEDAYVHNIQVALQNTVWNTGCSSWYVGPNNWNSMTYPWSQTHYWYRCLFPTWSDWIVKVRKPTHISLAS